MYLISYIFIRMTKPKMIVRKEITSNNELYLYMNGKCIYKRWLDGGYSKVFDVMAYDSYTYASLTDIELNNTEELIHVRALMKMKPTSKGGRMTGFLSGYRPNHVFEYKEGKLLNTFIGDIQFDHKELFMPGETHEVMVRFLFHMPIEKYLNIGRKWWIHEGRKVIGEAEILTVELPK